MSVSSDVIDWPEAMEQCGDDEDFLRELLSDLRGEIAVQVEKIEDVLKGPYTDTYYQHIQRASHVIKGAASNLMCHPLRQAAADLEKSAITAYNSREFITHQIREDVHRYFAQFCVAVEAYNDYLQMIGV
mmetsp:Transcript_15813/g.22603  ORF Transcript_15813/g.22603 Transcript_15813/m.22603 type:complete len:130 (+) Transcript_15813:93-482(+)